MEKSVDGVHGILTQGRRMVAQSKPRSYGGRPIQSRLYNELNEEYCQAGL